MDNLGSIEPQLSSVFVMGLANACPKIILEAQA
jgi:hypothetical protein